MRSETLDEWLASLPNIIWLVVPVQDVDPRLAQACVEHVCALLHVKQGARPHTEKPFSFHNRISPPRALPVWG